MSDPMRLPSPIIPLLVTCLAAGTGCAKRVAVAPEVPLGAPPVAAQDPKVTTPDRTIRYEPVVITARPEATPLADLNDEELFALGTAAYAAGDMTKAALHFEYLADHHAESPRRAAALHQAGLALERAKDNAGALGRFLDAATAYGKDPEAIDARFKAADQYYFLGDHDRAVDQLDLILQADLPVVRRAEADNKRAILLFHSGRLDEAEKALRTITQRILEDLRGETKDLYLPSQAQFFLAEVFRAYFLRVVLDPEKQTQAEMMEQLEYKAQMLLSAQGHYLRCIRLGHPEWATAGGYRIGELYQNLYEQLVDARPPADLEDAEQAQVYREELHKKIRVLVEKAIDIYEKTLATAERVGAQNPFVAQTREQLEKMKALLVKEDATAGGPAEEPKS